MSLTTLDKMWLVTMATSEVAIETELGETEGVGLISAELWPIISVDESTVDVLSTAGLGTSDTEGVG